MPDFHKLSTITRTGWGYIIVTTTLAFVGALATQGFKIAIPAGIVTLLAALFNPTGQAPQQ